MVISIVIDSDRGHSYEYFKKTENYDENWVSDMYLNVCVCDKFLSSQKCEKKFNFGLFRPNLCELGLFHPYFVCKCSFRVISMIKMVIGDQSKPILLYLKIKNLKIQKSKIHKLYVYYSYKPK